MDQSPADENLENVISRQRHAEKINEVMFAIANAVNTTLNLDDLYRSLHRSLSRIIDVTNFFIAIVDSSRQTLYFPYHVDSRDDDFKPISNFNAKNSLTGKVVMLREPVLMGEVDLQQRAAQKGVYGSLPLNWMGVPLIVRDQVIGVMAVQSYSDPHRFNRQDLQVLAAVSDQTAIAIDRKRADDRLRRSERRFRQLFEQSNDAILIHRRGHIIDANNRACEMLGYRREQLYTLDIADLESKQNHTTGKDRIARVLSGQSVCFESEWNGADGRRIPIEISARIADPKTDVIQIIARDISERKRREEEKLQIEKLESIGILSGGIAHDFNNLLSVILGNISLAKNDSGPGNRNRSYLKAAEIACKRSKDLTRQLITFSRGGAPLKQTCSIKHLIRKTTIVAAGGTVSTPRVEIAADLLPVECDREQIGHALANILKNAVEAMPGGGVLKVMAVNALPDDGSGIRKIDLDIDKYIRITVADQGGGIRKENRLKIFDPYFSTKQRGEKKGMGLGLTTANSIVEKHNGYIRFESAADTGTQFHIYLPAAAVNEQEDLAAKQKHTAVAGTASGKTVLMMDDEKMILELGRIMLDRLGYATELAEDGEQALQLYQNALDENRPFDAVILDLTIKHGLSGARTLKKMLRIDPATRAIVSSGYSEDPVMTAPRAHGFVASLPKPYTHADLEKVMLEVLGK